MGVFCVLFLFCFETPEQAAIFKGCFFAQYFEQVKTSIIMRLEYFEWVKAYTVMKLVWEFFVLVGSWFVCRLPSLYKLRHPGCVVSKWNACEISHWPCNIFVNLQGAPSHLPQYKNGNNSYQSLNTHNMSWASHTFLIW